MDRIVVQQFTDENTLYAGVLSGAIDLAPHGALSADKAVDLNARWERDSGGRVYFGTGRLVTEYRTSLREDQRGEALRQVQNIMLDDLPLLLLNYQLAAPFARRGVTSFQDDFPGGAEAGRLYGTYTRNAHEWDIVG